MVGTQMRGVIRGFDQELEVSREVIYVIYREASLLTLDRTDGQTQYS